MGGGGGHLECYRSRLPNAASLAFKGKCLLLQAEIIETTWYFKSFSFLVKNIVTWSCLDGNSIQITRTICWL